MGIRHAMQNTRGAALAVAFTLLACASLGVVLHGRTQGPSGDPDNQRAWYTIDDGKTWFADHASRVPPFDHQGKPAVRCYVYTCGDGKPWVSHLMRYTPEGAKHRATPQPLQGFDPASLAKLQSTVEVKPPGTGDKGWLKLNDPKAAAFQTPKCPHGTDHNITPVEPSG
jgi:hypothetical protein